MDVGRVSIDQIASIQLDAFPSTVYGSLQAKLNYVSADVISESGTDGSTRIFISVDSHLAPIRRTVGLSFANSSLEWRLLAEIKTGRRSIMTYLANLLLRAFQGALSER